MTAQVNTVLPVIAGDALVGKTLTVSQGTWTGGVQSYAYQWHRVNSHDDAITGATSYQYVVTATDTGHELYCVVTATNNTGSTSAQSANTATVLGTWYAVEDGTAKSDSNSYLTLEEANLYHASRNHTDWTLLNSNEKEHLLVIATDYIEQKYGQSWQGQVVKETQSLSFPRTGVVVNGYEISYTTIPSMLKNAVAELAIKANSSELVDDLTQGLVSEKACNFEQTYDIYSSRNTQYVAVERMIKPLLCNQSSINVGLYRV